MSARPPSGQSAALEAESAPAPRRSLAGRVILVLILQHGAGIGSFLWMVMQNRRADARSGHALLSDWQRAQEFGIIGMINLSSTLAISAAAGTLILALLPPDRRWPSVLWRMLAIALLQALWIIPCMEITLNVFEGRFPPVRPG